MTILNYLYVSDEHDARLGHNIIAGSSYLLTVFLAIIMIISGFFMLFPETPFWEKCGLAIFGSQQNARFIHHVCMWWFMIFPIIHLYFCLWNDIKSPEGLISSIFNGVKITHK